MKKLKKKVWVLVVNQSIVSIFYSKPGFKTLSKNSWRAYDNTIRELLLSGESSELGRHRTYQLYRMKLVK